MAVCINKMYLTRSLKYSYLIGVCSVSFLLTISTAHAAAGYSWAQQNGSLASNGAIIVKPLSGSSSSGSKNVFGSIAKDAQNAVAQAPAVHIPSSSNNRWSMYYKDRIAGLPGAGAGGSGAIWAHQNGSLSSNGSITVLSLSGGSYTTTQNPAGVLVQSNRSATTQMPTIIISSGNNGWSMYYRDRAGGLP